MLLLKVFKQVSVLSEIIVCSVLLISCSWPGGLFWEEIFMSVDVEYPTPTFMCDLTSQVLHSAWKGCAVEEGLKFRELECSCD